MQISLELWKFISYNLLCITRATASSTSKGSERSYFMKDGIHPQYNDNVVVTCACGNTFTTGSTVKQIDTEICSNCHPFYTGKQKLLDTRGNVDRFAKRRELAAKVQAEKKEKKPRKTRAKAA